MRVLIVGYGSIGQRHARNLVAMGDCQVSVFDPISVRVPFYLEGTVISCVSDLGEIQQHQFDAAFICSPNHLHVQQATMLAQAGCHLFVEKPLSNALVGIEELVDIVRAKLLVTMVGCNLLFDTPLRLLKQTLDQGSLGEVLSVNAWMRHDLPSMRPGIDVSTLYATKSEQGGGVILDSGSHEIQYLCHFFGPLESFQIEKKHRRLFGSDIEEEASVILNHQTGVTSTLVLDYLSKVRMRGLTVVGNKGTFQWQEFGKPPRRTVYLYTGNSEAMAKALLDEEEGEDQYVLEARYFINCIRKNEQTINPIDQAYLLQQALVEMRSVCPV